MRRAGGESSHVLPSSEAHDRASAAPSDPRPGFERGPQDRIYAVLCSDRFVDRSPAEVVATLLDEGAYLCSERTMYRVLASRAPVQERRP